MNLIKKFVNSYKSDSETWIKGLAVIAILILVVLGFDKRTATLEDCWGSVSTYVTAEFSEMSTEVDSEGNLYTDWDHWSEPASVVNKVVTHNGTLFSINGNFTTKESAGTWYPPIPDKWDVMRKDASFDDFKNHIDATLRVHVREHVSGEKSDIGQNVRKANSCIERLDSIIIVSTWYGITFSSNL